MFPIAMYNSKNLLLTYIYVMHLKKEVGESIDSGINVLIIQRIKIRFE